jgi:hypothetical protein
MVVANREQVPNNNLKANSKHVITVLMLIKDCQKTHLIDNKKDNQTLLFKIKIDQVIQHFRAKG